MVWHHNSTIWHHKRSTMTICIWMYSVAKAIWGTGRITGHFSYTTTSNRHQPNLPELLSWSSACIKYINLTFHERWQSIMVKSWLDIFPWRPSSPIRVDLSNLAISYIITTLKIDIWLARLSYRWDSDSDLKWLWKAGILSQNSPGLPMWDGERLHIIYHKQLWWVMIESMIIYTHLHDRSNNLNYVLMGTMHGEPPCWDLSLPPLSGC